MCTFVLRIDNIKYMYKKKIPLDLDCGVAIAMEVMGGKWKSCILYELEKGCKRPSELHRHFEDTSPRVINQQLKELEIHGMIEKTIYPELPPHVEYSITDDGRSLIPIIRMRTSAPCGIFHHGRRAEPYPHYPDAGTMGK